MYTQIVTAVLLIIVKKWNNSGIHYLVTRWMKCVYSYSGMGLNNKRTRVLELTVVRDHNHQITHLMWANSIPTRLSLQMAYTYPGFMSERVTTQ